MSVNGLKRIQGVYFVFFGQKRKANKFCDHKVRQNNITKVIQSNEYQSVHAEEQVVHDQREHIS